MRIAVDGTALWGQRRYSGVEKVVDRILYHLALNPHEHQIRILVPSDWSGFENPYEGPENGREAASRVQHVVERLPFPGSQKWKRIAWQQLFFPRWLREWKADHVFCPTYIMPLRSPCPTTVIVHDLHGLRLRQTRWPNYLHYRLLLPPTLRRAASILTPTHTVLEEVRPYISRRTKIAAVPWGIDEFFSPAKPGHATELNRCILYVGNLEKRKGLLMLLRAYGAVRRFYPSLDLMLVGKNLGLLPTLRSEAARLGIQDHVHFPGFVANEHLVELYRGAALLALTSEAEGFGMTPLEAMACGTPVVVVDTLAARETLGDAAVYAPANVESLSQAIRMVMERPERQQELRAAGLLRAASFTWDHTMDAVWKALELDAE